MADPTTTNIVLNVPTTGSDSGTWGTSLNNNFNALDAIFGTVTTTSLTNANVTLNTSQSQASILRFTGTLTGNCVITLGAIIKFWVFENNTTGAFTVTVKGNPGTGNVIGLPPGSCQAYWDGTNMAFLNLDKIGAYWDYAGTAVPAWVTACTVPPYLNCDGTTFSAVTYPLLNAILGGTTLPDSRGRFRATLNQTTGRLTSGGGGLNGNTNLSGAGAETNTLVTGNLPAYTPAGVILMSSPLSLSSNPCEIAVTGPVGTGGILGAQYSSGSGSYNLSASFTGNPQGGTSTAFGNVPPGYIGGITLIRAA